MAGVKRRTPYRKQVTDSVLYELVEPTEAQKVALVLRSHGSNLLELQAESGVVGLAMLPTKFRKLVWIKRGDFVIISAAEGDFTTADGSAGRVRFMIDHILYADQIKHLKACGKWPAAFESAAAAAGAPDAGVGGDVAETVGDAEAPSMGAPLPALKSHKPVGKKANGGKGAAGAKGAGLDAVAGAGGKWSAKGSGQRTVGGGAALAAAAFAKARAVRGAGGDADADEDAGEEDGEDGGTADGSAAWVHRQRGPRDLPPSDDEDGDDEEEEEAPVDAAGNTIERSAVAPAAAAAAAAPPAVSAAEGSTAASAARHEPCGCDCGPACCGTACSCGCACRPVAEAAGASCGCAVSNEEADAAPCRCVPGSGAALVSESTAVAGGTDSSGHSDRIGGIAEAAAASIAEVTAGIGRLHAAP
jgi:probable RNA-binding protein EIF1AD